MRRLALEKRKLHSILPNIFAGRKEYENNENVKKLVKGGYLYAEDQSPRMGYEKMNGAIVHTSNE